VGVIPAVRITQPTLVRPFHHEGWVYEEKVDGYRMVAYKDGTTSGLSAATGVITQSASLLSLLRLPGSTRPP